MQIRVLTLISYVLLLVSLAAPGVSLAQDWFEGFTSDKPPDSLTRDLMAHGLSERIDSINRAIPTLSPEQSAWLEAERSEMLPTTKENAGRAMNFILSTEFALERAKVAIDGAATALALLADDRDEPAAHRMTLWAVASYYLSTPDLLIYLKRLKDREIVSLSDEDLRPFEVVYPTAARAILNQILIPYLSPDFIR